MGHHGNSFLSFGGEPGAVGGWVELGRTTLGSAGDDIDVTSFSDKRYYMVLTNGINSGVLGLRTRVGTTTIDTGSNYARRNSNNGGTDATAVNQNFADLAAFDQAVPNFQVAYAANLSANEKLIQGWSINGQASGAATAPQRTEGVAKWVNTVAPLQSWRSYNASTGDFATDSELVVLGWDPTDTHTTNFWEEIFSEQLTSDNGSFSTGTITAKKYLWLQFYQVGHTGNSTLTFNSDTGTNYSKRSSANGGTDSTVTSASNLINVLTAGTADPASFANMFIMNNSAQEKLGIIHSMSQNTAGAGNAPFRVEAVTKWANTAAQITSVQVDDTGAGFDTGSFLKIWGSD